MFNLKCIPEKPGSKKYIWEIDQTPEREEGLNVNILFEANRIDENDYETVRRVIGIIPNTTWVSPSPQKWIFDLEQLKKQYPKLASFSWFNGKIQLEPKIDRNVYKNWNEPRAINFISLYFYITPDKMVETKKRLADYKYETLFSSYTLNEQIGEGGAGVVYSAVDEDNTTYAIKVIKQAVSYTLLKRFKNEVFFSLRNSNPNILSLHDYGFSFQINGNVPFYVMPFYNKTLRALIKEGILPNKVIEYFVQILQGIGAAHNSGVFHRDLKPENILYDVAKDKLVIGDFGIAHFSEEHLLTSVETESGTRLGNFEYAAPEQRRKDDEVNEKADIYALGLILNEMFTRAVAHGSEYKKIGDVYPNFSYLDDLVNDMLKQSPKNRPSVFDLISHLKQQNGILTKPDSTGIRVIQDKQQPATQEVNINSSIDFQFTGQDFLINKIGEFQLIDAAKKAIFNTSSYPFFPFMRDPSKWPLHKYKDSGILLEFSGSKPSGTLYLDDEGSISISIDEIDDSKIMKLEWICYLTTYIFEYFNRYLAMLRLGPFRKRRFVLSAKKYKNCLVDYSGLPESERLPLLAQQFAPNIPDEKIPIAIDILLPIDKNNPDDVKNTLNAVQHILKSMTFMVEGKRLNPLGQDTRSRLNISAGVIDNIIWNALYTIQDSTIIDTDKYLRKEID